MADFTEVSQLLHVFKGTHEHGEAFKHIRDAAMSRLKAINDEHAPKTEEPVAEEPKAEEAPAEEEPVELVGDDDEHMRRV